MKKFLLLLAFLSVCSCGTIVQHPVNIKSAAPDTSTPKQYFSKDYGINDNGFIGYRVIDGIEYGIITPNKKQELDNLVGAYHDQFKSIYFVWLNVGDGISAWKDPFGNILYKVDETHLRYYCNLEAWKRMQRPVDSLWLKALTEIKKI